MTHDEMRALVADCKQHSHIQDWHARHLIAAIETLLADLGAIREAVEQHSDCYNTALCDAVREIINNGDTE